MNKQNMRIILSVISFLFLTARNGKSTSIMNDVAIGKNELHPPTIFNHSSSDVAKMTQNGIPNKEPNKPDINSSDVGSMTENEEANKEPNKPDINSSDVGSMTQNGKQNEDIKESDINMNLGTTQKNILDVNAILTHDDIIGQTTVELSGQPKMDVEETMLGDTVADAFLMSSWDDIEIR